MEDEILIDNYLKGLLTKNEEKSFLERLDSDTEFKENFKLEEELFNALVGVLLRVLKQRLKITKIFYRKTIYKI